MPGLLPTHRDPSPSSSSSTDDEAPSSNTTQVASQQPEVNEKRFSSGNPEAKVKDESEDGYDDQGLIEVEEDGQKRQVRVVLEHKSGREMLKEVSGGQYTIPRW